MVDPSLIREQMSVVGSDGGHVGTVDAVEGNRLKLTAADSRDGTHHYVSLTYVDRVDTAVHLAVPAISAVPGGSGEPGPAAALGAAVENALPSTRNRVVAGAAPRRNYYLPWIVGLIGILLALALFKGCVNRHEAVARPPTDTNVVTTDNAAATAGTAPAGVSGLGSYLGGTEPVPRTFTFEKLNFDTNRSEVRAADRDEVAQVAAVLKQYGTARVRIAGYADARGPDPANRQLGQARADTVKAALVGQGIAADRIETVSGGEQDPVATNAIAPGRFENRRTELVVTAR